MSTISSNLSVPTPRLTAQSPPPGWTPAEEAGPGDEFRPGPAPEPEIRSQSVTHSPSGLARAVVCTGLLLSAASGFAASPGVAHLAANRTVTSQLMAQASELGVNVLPEGTPRIDVIRPSGLVKPEHSRVGAALGDGLFQDAHGNLSLVPTQAFGWDAGAHDFKRVDLGTKGEQKVERFGTTVHYVESSTKRLIYTETANHLELKGPKGTTSFDRAADGSVHVKGPKIDYTVVHEGLYTRILQPGQDEIDIVRNGNQLMVTQRNQLKGSATLTAEGALVVQGSNGNATVRRSANGLILEVDGSRGIKDATIIHDGDTYVGRRDKDRMTVDDKTQLAEARARYDLVMKQLNAVEPNFEENHPVVASVLEYAASNPKILAIGGDEMGFFQGGTLLATGGTALESASALTAQAAALNLASSARALGAAALSAQAAAQAQAQAGNLAQAVKLGQEAQGLATKARAVQAKAIKTGGKALKAANVARVMAGVGGVLQIVDGVVGIHKGRQQRSLVQGAIAVTEASMQQLSGKLQGQDRIEAQGDFDRIMKVMHDLNKQADKQVVVGGLKIGLGGLMIVSSLLGPEAPPILGVIGIAGTAGTAVYEHWGPIKSFLTGTSNHVPSFLDILPEKDRVVVHLEPFKE